MQEKPVTPSKFRPLQIPLSPVASSPGKNLTGSVRIARDIAADLFNTIQNWNDSHIKGALLVKQMAVLKSDSIGEYSRELEECASSLYLLVQNLKSYVEQFNKLKTQISALQKLEKKEEPLFISLSVRGLVDLVDSVVNGYLDEFKVKEMVLENIAHSKNKDEVMFFAACWTHQPNITSQINLKLEALLVETGHRKYCLSNDPNKPCHILTFREITMMLDCGLSMQSLLNFLPLSFVPSNKLFNLPNWMPSDTTDPDLEGELKENGDRVFVDSPPEFCPPLDKLIDFSQVDVILISNYLCMMALPFVTQGTGFKGRVYATEPTLQFGRLLLEEIVIYIEQCPKSSFATQWKNFVQKCPYPLNEAFKPKSWKQIYNMKNVNASLSMIQMVGYNEKVDVYGALQVIPASSGLCLGSANWVISTEHEKIVYLSGSSTLTTHPRPMDHHALKNADVLIMTDLTQTPISNPDSMLGVLCVVVGLTLRGGGNVLIPCYPTGVVYDLFECLSGKMQELGVSNCPMFFISPVADMSLAYSNILAEWLSSVKQNKVYVPDEPFPHALLVKSNKLKHFKHIFSDGFSTDFQEPCVVFCGHPSLRFGDVVQFIELWGNNPRNCIVFTEPDFDYIEALAPYQPLQIKVAHCAIDTSLNFTQANKLIKDLKPKTLVVPECYTQPPVSAPNLTELVIGSHIESSVIPYKWGEVINLPLKRKQGQAFMDTNVAQKIVPVEVKPGISLSTVTGALNVKDNVHNVQEMSGEFVPSELVKYEWGSLNITEFLQKLSQEGVTDAKVESLGGNVIVIHLQDEDALIQLEDNSTHVVCNADENLRTKLRNIVMQCLKKF